MSIGPKFEGVEVLQNEDFNPYKQQDEQQRMSRNELNSSSLLPQIKRDTLNKSAPYLHNTSVDSARQRPRT